MTSRQNTTFPSNGGTAHGYLAVPESGSGPGVILVGGAMQFRGFDQTTVRVEGPSAAQYGDLHLLLRSFRAFRLSRRETLPR